MSPPALSLRAPLLWLLLPLMAGFTAAGWWPLPKTGPGPLLGLAALAGGWALLSAPRARPWAWPLAIVLTTGLAGFVYLAVRFPYLHEWASRPPREVTVAVDVLQVFPGAPGARSLTGIGTINPATPDETLCGRRISFSVLRRLGPPPQRGGTYRMQGVLEPLPPDASGFNEYLINVGVRHRLSRARVLGVVTPPGRFQQFCAAADRRLQVILGYGLADQPAPRSLYLAMLLGEKAVLSPDQQNAFVRSGTFHILIFLQIPLLSSIIKPLEPSYRLTEANPRQKL
jgi:competence protein ComEC